ncbi:multimerin-2 [Hoplias malabaricus]|uniref:multimerin-2 n=1 Tax=Hoplias malabaricus TaxID=27720 RepID=UPI0034620F17
MVLTLLVFMLLHAGPCIAGLRARDPDLEDEMQGLRDSEADTSGTFDTAYFPIPHGHRHHSSAGPQQPSLGTPDNPLTPARDSPHQPARTGNWCAVVHQRVVTMAVSCGTEAYPLKSVKPCSDGDSDCQIPKYEPSSRPVYRQKEKIFTALHWKCCPGHRGHNCEETEAESQSSPEHPETTRTDNSGVDDSGVKETDFLEDGHWDGTPVQQPPSGPVFPASGHYGTGGAIPPSASLPFMDSATLLTFHQMFAAMMMQLQPVLDGFNRSLEHLSNEVEGLSMDLQKLRKGQEANMPKSRRNPMGTVEEKLDDSFVQIRQIQAQLDLQQKQMEDTVQAQQELLQNNLTILKEEIDHYINKSHEEIQVNLQSLSQSVEEVKLSQESLRDLMLGEYATSVRVSESQPAAMSGVWEAISRLDKKVLNNTMQLSALSENSTQLTVLTKKLDHCLQNVNMKLEQVRRNSDVQFAETGQELEAAKLSAFNSINELSSNFSSQQRQLRELELYLDNIYERIHQNEATTEAEDCSCKEISESLVTLQLKVANVTDLAKKNHYALVDAEATRGQAHWAMQVEDLHQALLHVKESLAFEQAKSRTLNDNTSQLKASLLGNQQEILVLKESFAAKAEEIRHLSVSFSSLLKDAIRHSKVLEVLLGDEVIEFSRWSDSQQKELSIPVLLERMRLMQGKIQTHEDNLVSLRRHGPTSEQMTSDDPVAFSDWRPPEGQGRDAEDHQEHRFLPRPSVGEDVDYTVSDFWSMGKEVEQLADRITQLEQHLCNCTGAPSGSVVVLQTEVASLQQALGDHVRIFQNLFSYTEELASPSHSLDLNRVWAMIRRKERKRNKGQIRKDQEGSSSIRRKRSTGEGPSHSTVAFITSLQHTTNTRGTLIPERVDLNRGNAFRSSSGEFHAPQTGVYLFLVTLNLGKGPCLAQLRHGMVPVASFRQVQGEGGPLSRTCLLELQRGEKMTLKLLKGRLQGQLHENTLSGVLLFSTEDKDKL